MRGRTLRGEKRTQNYRFKRAGPASRGGRAEGADVTRMRAGPGRAALARRRRRPPELSPLPLPLPPALLLRPGLLPLRPGLLPLRPGLRRRPGALSPGSQGVSPPHWAYSTKAGGTWGPIAGRAVETWAALTPAVQWRGGSGAPGRARSRGQGCRARGRVQPSGTPGTSAGLHPWEKTQSKREGWGRDKMKNEAHMNHKRQFNQCMTKIKQSKLCHHGGLPRKSPKYRRIRSRWKYRHRTSLTSVL
ncbi:uncharacterized protein LOC115836668 [Nomascus leucogenys]|uniref:uncharacterized protein LOC115836668 n=1 Tax=Nomascus leucogenys TaxID=61853 RepID=UPI00122DA596|nr:uncharacterized protein LOC115836668 [Nomascus leucogenys]